MSSCSLWNRFAREVGAISRSSTLTPNFDKLAPEAILFTRFYANGVQTTRGALATLYSTYPRLSISSVQSSYNKIRLIGLPHIFRGRGYQSVFMHNGSLTLENKDPFFLDHGFQEIHGVDDMRQRYSRAPWLGWGIPDEYLMRYSVDWLKRQDKPSFLTMFTVSNHHPWRCPPGFTPTVKPGADQYSRFQGSIEYSDKMLGLFTQLLQEEGLWENTVLVVLSDTGQPMGEHNDNYMEVRALYEEHIHIPCLILAPGYLKQPARIDAVASQVDLMPTLLDIFRISAVNHCAGRSLKRQCPHSRAFVNSPYNERFLAGIESRHKLIYGFVSNDYQLYDLHRDPGERSNIFSIDNAVATRIFRRIRSDYQISHQLLEQNTFVPAAVLERVESDPATLFSPKLLELDQN